MSLFRKPTKRIQRRVFGCDDDEDEGEPEPPPPPIISKEKKEHKPTKSIPLLSFADEEEEGEVFKVKKSTHSKRWARRKEKEKKKAIDSESKTEYNNFAEDITSNINEDMKLKKPKKLTLEGLILAGREALAADGAGDISDGEEELEDDDDEDTGGFPRYRAESVRAALAAAAAPGLIPDAALIHAARKTRQQARELGGGDYISIRSEGTSKGAPGSRLIHDDGSGDDEEEGRILVRGLELPSDKPKRGTAAAESDVDLDSEGEQWEEQQMQKAMPTLTDIGMEGVEANPFSVPPPPPPPRLADAPAHLRPLAARAAHAPADLVLALADRLSELRAARAAAAARRAAAGARLLAAARTREARAARAAPLDAAYRRAQAVRGYLTDLIECLDEKMPALEALEARALALHRRRCEQLQERRRADVRDQAQDVLAMFARPGAARAADSEEKVRRTAEREGRRRARRLRREAAAGAHRDGDSSDDDLPPAALQHHRAERESIAEAARALFADALPAWRGVRGAARRLQRWRRAQPALYRDAYVADCLPRLLAPYVRHQLILWNPLADEDNEDYEKMDWYKCLMMYGVKSEKTSSDSEDSEHNDEEEVLGDESQEVTEDSVRDDSDLMLVPTIVHNVVLAKVTELVECAWEPMCVRACVRLRVLLLRAASLPPPAAAATAPTAAAAPELRRLAAAVRARLAAAVAADVFLPALPPQAWSGPGGAGAGGAKAFWWRCLGAGVRLLRAALALSAPPLLLPDALALSLVGTLCTAAGAAPAAAAAGAAAALASTLPARGRVRALALRRLAALAAHALARLDCDNPVNLKALEQARAVMAEARNAE